MFKRLIALLLFSIIILTLTVPVFATNNDIFVFADKLYKFGLLKGVGLNSNGTPNFDLDRAPTRQEAITMLVRLLGKEEDALNGTWNTPFTDVDAWAQPYVGYAYDNSLTYGTSEVTFGASDTVTASQYITFVLRALGYNSDIDFTWDRAWELSDTIGITNGNYSKQTTFLRGDVVVISHNTLYTKIKSSQKTLLDLLMTNGIISLNVFSMPIYGEFARYYKENSNIYRLPSAFLVGSASPVIGIINVNGQDEYYVPIGQLYDLLSLCYGYYHIEPTEEPFITGMIVYDFYLTQPVENQYIWTKNDLKMKYENIQTGISSYYTSISISLGDKTFMVSSDEMLDNGTNGIYIKDGIKLIEGGDDDVSYSYINIYELFDLFNIDKTISIVTLNDGTKCFTIE